LYTPCGTADCPTIDRCSMEMGEPLVGAPKSLLQGTKTPKTDPRKEK